MRELFDRSRSGVTPVRFKRIARLQYGEALAAEQRCAGSVDVYGSNGIVGDHDRANTTSPCVLVGRKGSFGKVNYSERSCFAIDTVYFLDSRSTKASLRWLYYVLLTLGLDQTSRDSAIPGLDRPEVHDALVPNCSSREQVAIAHFLDSETSKIDDLIAKKQRLIELLDEKRSALISRAVSHGLDRGVKMKESGIAWLGRVPATWSVRRVGTLAAVVRGASPRPAGSPEYFNGDHTPWITVGDLTQDSGKYLDHTETSLTAAGAMLSRVVPAGTVLLTNSGFSLGVPRITRISGCINDGSVAFLNLSPDLSAEFLYYFLRSITVVLRDCLRQGVDQPNLNTNLVRATSVPIPSIQEQLGIVSALDELGAQITSLEASVSNAIGLLREYRSALITAAVTGQLDIREHEEKMEALA
jgi:type I restriction enzyme S subunit